MKRILYYFCLCVFSVPLAASGPGIHYFQKHQYQKSQQYFAAQLKQDKKNSLAHYYLGRSLFQTGQYRHAATSLLQAINLRPDQPRYHYWLARAYGESARYSNFVRQAFLAPKIRRGFEAAVRLDPGAVDARIGLANFYMQAPRMMGGSKVLALQQASAIGKLDAVEGQLIVALIYERQKKHSAAENIYQELIKRHGTKKQYAHIYDHYGTLLLNQKRYPDSLAMYKKQILLVPKKDGAYVTMGRALQKMRQYKKALEFYQRALAINQYNRQARSRMKTLIIQLDEN